MNPITMHAVGLARCGNWRLLDALEVRARARTEATFAGMMHAPGAVALLGYLDAQRADADPGSVRCPECDGDGEIEITGATGRVKYIDCPWCDGDGEVDADDASAADTCAFPAECRRWTTLNGEPAEFDPGPRSYNSSWMSISEASRVIAEYTGLVNRLAGDAARGAE